MFLCYDVKGIQSFIFRIPKLRYIIGGSALVDRLDRVTARELRVPGTRLLFAGGGRGAFACDDAAAAEALKARLVHEAHAIGADVAFGSHPTDFSAAATSADLLYPCLPLPEQMGGHPCPKSGWPLAAGDEHPHATRRIFSRGTRMARYFEDQLLQDLPLPPGLQEARCEFFHDVNPEDAERDDRFEARRAQRALGDRNRWAVIAMDGNDMGAQFRWQNERLGSSPSLTEWVREASGALDDATRAACRAGVGEVIKRWTEDLDAGDRRDLVEVAEPVILPVRPLVVGGDDIVVLCHVRHAFDFVKEACRVFSNRASLQSRLWPATGGRLTITAGILFAPVSLPLSTAIAHAESLLASAKERGRRDRPEGSASPPCVDWQSVTASVLEPLAVSRDRDLAFRDGDRDRRTIRLTRRPYTLGELDEVEELAASYANVPRSLIFQTLPSMRQAFWDRQAWLARLGKREHLVVDHLKETLQGPAPGSRWRTDGGEQSTDVLDAIDLLAETHRMSHRTAEPEG